MNEELQLKVLEAKLEALSLPEVEEVYVKYFGEKADIYWRSAKNIVYYQITRLKEFLVLGTHLDF